MRGFPEEVGLELRTDCADGAGRVHKGAGRSRSTEQHVHRPSGGDKLAVCERRAARLQWSTGSTAGDEARAMRRGGIVL